MKCKCVCCLVDCDQLIFIAAQPTDRNQRYRLLSLCEKCFDNLEGDDGPDMWTTQAAYEELKPKTTFDDLKYDTR